LGLSPNASRVAVRFWIVDTVAGMATKICRHFEDLRVAHGSKERDYLSLFRLLASIAVQGKSENIPPNLAGDTVRAVLEGLPYPHTLLQAAVRRIKAEHDITYPRAALIKACLNRYARFRSQQGEEMAMSLDTTNINIGYRLGRLFATLEKIQQEANPKVAATIRDKFYGAASSTPVTVFGNLMRLKNHHLAKLESPGRRVNLEKLIGEIISEIGDFPAHLTLEDQGRFAIGYYHQMQDFFTKKSE
jgi:CRISPR-associated protein Csd1